MTNRPVPSITVTPSGTVGMSPIASILPLRIRMEALSSLGDETGMIVAFLISTLPPVCVSGMRSALISTAQVGPVSSSFSATSSFSIGAGPPWSLSLCFSGLSSPASSSFFSSSISNFSPPTKTNFTLAFSSEMDLVISVRLAMRPRRIAPS